MYKLIEIKQKHLAWIYKGLSDEKVTRYYAVHFSSLEHTQEQMDWYANLREEKKGSWWLIKDISTQEFVGAGGCNDLDVEHAKAEIGFWLYPEFWGKGILNAVMPDLFAKGFFELGLNRIEGFVDADNVKCKRVLQKVNFKHEGTLREVEKQGDRFVDIDVYSVLKGEFDESMYKKATLKEINHSL